MTAVGCSGVPTLTRSILSSWRKKSVRRKCVVLSFTHSYSVYLINLLCFSLEWFVWKGLVESEYRVSIECNECEVGQDETCNYNGVCVDEKCDCNNDHFGTFCEFLRPCDVIRCKCFSVSVSVDLILH